MRNRRPEPIADVLAELLARRGYAGQHSARSCAEAWREAVGDYLADRTRTGRLRRGALEIVAASSTLVQELMFAKPDILRKLAELVPEQSIQDLRFRVGHIS